MCCVYTIQHITHMLFFASSLFEKKHAFERWVFYGDTVDGIIRKQFN